MPSRFKESILSGIGYGFNNRMEISTYTGIGYNSVSNNIRSLLNCNSIKKHKSKQGDLYTLSKKERWRLYYFDHIKLFIENETPYIFYSNNELYTFEDFSIKKSYLDGEGEIAIIHNNREMEEILDLIDNQYILKNYIPILIVSSQSKISLKLISNLKSFILYQLPIFFINENYEIIPFFIPKRCFISKFNNESFEYIIHTLKKNPLKSTSEIANILHIDKETARKKLKILNEKGLIKAVKKDHFVETVWKILSKNP